MFKSIFIPPTDVGSRDAPASSMQWASGDPERVGSQHAPVFTQPLGGTMITLPRLTARLAVVASFAALLGAACSPDSNAPSSTGPSNAALLATRQRGGGGAGGSFAVLGQAAVSCSGGSILGDVGTFQATPP